LLKNLEVGDTYREGVTEAGANAEADARSAKEDTSLNIFSLYINFGTKTTNCDKRVGESCLQL